ncbi:hypothetical protein M9H77_04398 [Catharanthus roseus]|uniref:Uncharacterized protein n=1 Tax=Catharanthus roseus TaxID=4058 RepID=A0ACC0CE59_CATRO|nr:hypothetical protein M9H77_04398 [Catharanthus roseus]
MHRSGAPYRDCLLKTVYSCCEAEFGYTQVFFWEYLYVGKCLSLEKLHYFDMHEYKTGIHGYSSGYDHVFGSVRGLHCTWLVPLRLFGDQAPVWYSVGIDYEMPELDFDDLVLGSGLCPWSPTIALHISLNSGVEAALICLDSLRLPSRARNPHVGLGISIVKIIKENVFLYHCMNCFRETASSFFQRNH